MYKFKHISFISSLLISTSIFAISASATTLTFSTKPIEVTINASNSAKGTTIKIDPKNLINSIPSNYKSVKTTTNAATTEIVKQVISQATNPAAAEAMKQAASQATKTVSAEAIKQAASQATKPVSAEAIKQATSQAIKPVINSNSTAKSTVKYPIGTGTIKGNINSKGEKIYHTTSSRSYNRTIPEYLFKTTKEAEAAGFRAARD